MIRRGAGIGIIFLVSQLMQTGLENIPSVTLAVILLNSAVYLRVFNNLPSVYKACISYAHVIYGQDWNRIILSPFYHLDDIHLYYNMTSFLWKGMILERRLGSFGMLYLLLVFSILTGIVLLCIDYCLAMLLNDFAYLHTCAAGFSGVIFALKVVTTYNLPMSSMTNVFLFNVPSRIACWVELVLIQVVAPATSFTGHLAGIIVGLLYVTGPLKQIMNFTGNIIMGTPVRELYRSRPSYTYHSQQSGYHSMADEDDQLQTAIDESLNDFRQHNQQTLNSNLPVSNEDIRQRRLRRFQN